MGEAKRRKELDPTFGKNRMNDLRKFCNYILEELQQQHIACVVADSETLGLLPSEKARSLEDKLSPLPRTRGRLILVIPSAESDDFANFLEFTYVRDQLDLYTVVYGLNKLFDLKEKPCD